MLDPSAWVTMIDPDTASLATNASGDGGSFISFTNQADVDNLERKRSAYLMDGLFADELTAMPSKGPSGDPDMIVMTCSACGEHPAGSICECGKQDESELMEMITTSINNDSKPKANNDYLTTTPSFQPTVDPAVLPALRLSQTVSDRNKAKHMYLATSVNMVNEIGRASCRERV